MPVTYHRCAACGKAVSEVLAIWIDGHAYGPSCGARVLGLSPRPPRSSRPRRKAPKYGK